ncbi:Exodeoxyribonuclease 7 large subunit [bioreactor metagenome]|uniref:Exodeoxyribonuclease 7 large subunit n=1 Tax=bioreactor metagenome TaxID=1076179 RepID=A0A645C0H7_9ZZZZ|nr:exodeoxyribonuclease VII large subunit [Candidatus Metalachnospira sp.]
MLEPKIYSVSKINGYISTLLENDFVLRSIWVAGEISNFKYHSSGHMYFSLKDSESVINCIMFRADADMLPFMPESGMSVIVYGNISVYEKSGQYSIVCELMEPDGVGALTVAFEQLKAKLGEEGLFDTDYKREINTHPKNIAVVTSPTGAAVRDIIKIAGVRNKNVSVTVIPVFVQGDNAAGSIAEGIRIANRLGKADTIIVGRGGGSIEDLWAFNEEKVARAIFASEIPVISAVGHETDFTIADFVADVRASTPSNAAEIAVNDEYADRKKAEYLIGRLGSAVSYRIDNKYGRFERAVNNVSFKTPQRAMLKKGDELQYMTEKMRNLAHSRLNNDELVLASLASTLDALSPLKVLKRGYSFTDDGKGNAISSVNEIEVGSEIDVTLTDGRLSAVVKDKVVFGG